jgi:SAM-dependent methyltransferase
MAESLIRAWWARLRGELEPAPCPFSHAWILEMPQRAMVAAPARVLRAFDIRAGARVLEIGPGTGYYSMEAARRVGDGGRLLCLDIQRAMLHATRRRAQQTAQSNVDFICGDAAAHWMSMGPFPFPSSCRILTSLLNEASGACWLQQVLRSSAHGAGSAMYRPGGGRAPTAPPDTRWSSAQDTAEFANPLGRLLLCAIKVLDQLLLRHRR